MTTLSACCIKNFIQHLYCWIQLDKILDIHVACGKSGHSSALLNVNLTFQFLECKIIIKVSVWGTSHVYRSGDKMTSSVQTVLVVKWSIAPTHCAGASRNVWSQCLESALNIYWKLKEFLQAARILIWQSKISSIRRHFKEIGRH